MSEQVWSKNDIETRTSDLGISLTVTECDTFGETAWVLTHSNETRLECASAHLCATGYERIFEYPDEFEQPTGPFVVLI